MSRSTNPDATTVPLVIVGGGAAGMMASVAAAEGGARPLLVEAGSRVGRKILISGGSRCNLTHEGEPKEILEAFGPGGRFLRAATWEFPPRAVCEWFAARGLDTYAQPDGCVFPGSDEAADVVRALAGELKRLGVTFHRHRRVVSVGRVDAGFVVRTNEATYTAKKLVVATGGCSYPTTGSTGDGWTFARALGHTIVRPRPALVPLETAEPWVSGLAGVSVADVALTATPRGERPVTCRGDLLFAHWGVSGPVALRLAWRLADYLTPPHRHIPLTIDLLPDRTFDDLDIELQRLFAENPRRRWPTIVGDMAPTALVKILAAHLGPTPAKPVAEMTRDERRRIVSHLKTLPLTVTKPRPIEQAIAVRGGVSRDEIDPKTMESRLHKGLYFAGEVMDVDGDCGGYNLQIAWSTGRLAGRMAAGPDDG